jgi:membrane protein DedA with SNARE-associated domain
MRIVFTAVRFLRKRWHILVILAAVAAVAGYYMYQPDNPVRLLRKYGYWIILGWTFLEGETIVIVASWASASVGLDPPLIAAAAFCGSFLSDQIMFSIGKYKGDVALSYFPRISRNVDKAARLFKKYDTLLILGFRFVYGVRNITPILLGISGVSHKKFFALNSIGAAVWAASFTYGGLYLGKAFMRIVDHVGHGIFYALLTVLAVAGALWFFRSRKTVKKARETVLRDKAAADSPGPAAKTREAADGPEETIDPETGKE